MAEKLSRRTFFEAAAGSGVLPLTAGAYSRLRGVCDLWSVNRERAAVDGEKLFGTRPKTYKYSEELLADPQLDAVMIATGDFQHARVLAEAVRAGKDCYCEKPMANTLEDAKLARETGEKGTGVWEVGP